MKLLMFITLLTLSCSSVAKDNRQSADPLGSNELQSIKKKYEACVFSNGSLVLKNATFRDAMEYAPMACRKELLLAKKLLLDSAFKIEVIDQLVSSIEEGVKIDLAGRMIKQLENSKQGN